MARNSFASQTPKEHVTALDNTPLTDLQKQHSKLYSQYRREEKIRDLAAELQEDVQLLRGIPLSGGYPGMPNFKLESFLASTSCEADAIIVGRVSSGSSQITEDGTFLFTDYELQIKKVFKNNLHSRITRLGNLIVTYPGGVVQLNNRIIRAEDRSFLLLKPGGEYLLFLKFIPETGAYQVFNSKANFHIENAQVTKLTEEGIPPALANIVDLKSLLRDVKAALTKGCS